MKKKVLFIDRDGTLIKEPEIDFQVDAFEKLEFIPGAITWLRKLALESDYELVMVTNQDGLGTDSFPEENFWPVHNLMMKTFEGEGINFSEVLIDRSFEHENLPTRKPGTGMLQHYIDGAYDLSASYVIGDRVTDLQLAANLGCRGIYFSEKTHDKACLHTTSWEKIYEFLKMPPRVGVVRRTTRETDIKVEINLDGRGETRISTGLGFFDHMLDQLGKHGGIDISIETKGDLHIDEHHTIEDTGLALGEAFLAALGDKKGITRYGFLLPMDDCLAQAAIDFGGRPWLVWDAPFLREKVGDMPTEMFYHFFKSFTDTSKSNLNIKAEGTNEHHKIEAIFKAWAKAIKMAVKRDVNAMDQLPSTKGIL
ncbi:MAG: bifunctional histidinol-phosphatase/imidazoleglycerol-phosphate dehydratase HisB [Cyclobacteriaceae bacterium]|nr:bifunctional histidinol-phosphatase/imidazoleglycerol-phosphate dehydratase HisB [Cyclobacteriaceae bacterium]